MAGELQGDGKAIFTFFIGAIITIVFLASVADSVFTQTTTFSTTNETVTSLAVNSSLALTGRELTDTSTTETWNGTGNSSASSNLQNSGVIVDTRIINGVKTVALTINDTGSAFAGGTINVTYDFQPDGYISNAGGRSIALLIIIFGSLAILVFGLVVFIKDGTLGRLMAKTRSNR